MVKYVRFMGKKEIDDVVKSEGLSHIDAPLATNLQALKPRNIRFYFDAVKALYHGGPCRVSKEFAGHHYINAKTRPQREENSVRHILKLRFRSVHCQSQLGKRM